MPRRQSKLQTTHHGQCMLSMLLDPWVLRLSMLLLKKEKGGGKEDKVA